MTLIPEWKQAWRMLSMIFSGFALLWLGLPSEAQASVLRMLPWMNEERMAGALIVAAMVGRLIVQPKLRADSD